MLLGLTIVQATYVFFFVVAFSALPVGYGTAVFRELIENYALMYGCAGVGIGVFLLAYLSDVS